MNLPNRKRTRLKNYDYSTPGAYFVTICTKDKKCIFEIETAGRSLHDAMRWFKTMTTNEYIKGVKNGILKPFDNKLWQKSFHDHIIRGKEDYQNIWQYIDTNVLKWEQDKFYIHKRSSGATPFVVRVLIC